MARRFYAEEDKPNEFGNDAVRTGREGSSNAFTTREQANEDWYIRQREREQLERLRQKLQEEIKEVDKEIEKHNNNGSKK